MGFWESLGNAVVGVAGRAKEKMERINEYRARYDCYDDERLKEMYRSAYGDEKLALKMLLEERGY